MFDWKLSRRDFLRFSAYAAAGALLAACSPAAKPPEEKAGDRETQLNIGIIVYSKTGHTLSVANRLKEKLSAAGHAVTLERLETVGEASPNDASVELKTMPAIDGYDALVFGSPVWGGAPAAPTVSYLEQIPSLQDKRVAVLVTGAFPAGWGRNQTVAKMTELCESKGATIIGSGSVGWLSFRRKRQITEIVDTLTRLF